MPVDWLAKCSIEKAVWEKGLFAIQNTVCLRNSPVSGLDRLTRKPGIVSHCMMWVWYTRQRIRSGRLTERQRETQNPVPDC